ncbi:hypothetical protein BN946_scf184942.g24 [Trametes cinnabarina]|uniref:Uncharacterized protein n=1 Tax=Pycnoporus cinnabarinus TaxID=5643 RepID=A0A060SD60_PYCCI|nr:hypothetical protein BN946_scf184942.g24 [Trametes cinnabarina]
MRFHLSTLSLAVLLGVAIAAPLASNDLVVRQAGSGGRIADYKRAEIARVVRRSPPDKFPDWKRAEIVSTTHYTPAIPYLILFIRMLVAALMALLAAVRVPSELRPISPTSQRDTQSLILLVFPAVALPPRAPDSSCPSATRTTSTRLFLS